MKCVKLACSRRSDSGARAKNKVSPRFFPALSLAFFFARAPLSERLEQATVKPATDALSFQQSSLLP